MFSISVDGIPENVENAPLKYRTELHSFGALVTLTYPLNTRILGTLRIKYFFINSRQLFKKKKNSPNKLISNFV